jgi:hypothetical protein
MIVGLFWNDSRSLLEGYRRLRPELSSDTPLLHPCASLPPPPPPPPLCWFNTRQKAFCFFCLYAPENLATPQEHLKISPYQLRGGGEGVKAVCWLPSSLIRATPGLQGGGRSGWTVQASAVGGSCRVSWRSLLCSQRYVAPPRRTQRILI